MPFHRSGCGYLHAPPTNQVIPATAGISVGRCSSRHRAHGPGVARLVPQRTSRTPRKRRFPLRGNDPVRREKSGTSDQNFRRESPANTGLSGLISRTYPRTSGAWYSPLVVLAYRDALTRCVGTMTGGLRSRSLGSSPECRGSNDHGVDGWCRHLPSRSVRRRLEFQRFPSFRRRFPRAPHRGTPQRFGQANPPGVVWTERRDSSPGSHTPAPRGGRKPRAVPVSSSGHP
jgi:hypothetical protein